MKLNGVKKKIHLTNENLLQLKNVYDQMREIRLGESATTEKLNDSYEKELNIVDGLIKDACKDKEFTLNLKKTSEAEARFICEYSLADAEKGIPLDQTKKAIDEIFYPKIVNSIIKNPDELLKQFGQKPQLINDNKLLVLLRWCQRKINLGITQKLDNQALNSELFMKNRDKLSELGNQESSILKETPIYSVPYGIIVKKLRKLNKDINNIWKNHYSNVMNDYSKRFRNSNVNEIAANEANLKTYNWLKGYPEDEPPF